MESELSASDTEQLFTEPLDKQLADVTKLFSNSFPAKPAIPTGKFRITKHSPEYKLYNKLLNLIQDANLIPIVFEYHTPEPSLILDLTEFVKFDWFDLYSSDDEHAPEKFIIWNDTITRETMKHSGIHTRRNMYSSVNTMLSFNGHLEKHYNSNFMNNTYNNLQQNSTGRDGFRSKVYHYTIPNKSKTNDWNTPLKTVNVYFEPEIQQDNFLPKSPVTCTLNQYMFTSKDKFCLNIKIEQYAKSPYSKNCTEQCRQVYTLEYVDKTCNMFQTLIDSSVRFLREDCTNIYGKTCKLFTIIQPDTTEFSSVWYREGIPSAYFNPPTRKEYVVDPLVCVHKTVPVFHRGVLTSVFLCVSDRQDCSVKNRIWFHKFLTEITAKEYSSADELFSKKFTLCTDLGYNESVYDIASHETGITAVLLRWTILLFDSAGHDGTKSLDPECNMSGQLTIRKKINLRQELNAFDVFIMNLPDRDIKHRQLCFINSYCLAVRIDNEIRRVFF